MRLPLTALLLASLWLGCPERASTPTTADGGVATSSAGEDAAAPTLPERLELTVRAQIPDAGIVDVPFAEGVVPEIPPAEALELSTNLPLTNYRVRLFDEVDRAMVSDDEPQEGPEGLRYRIQLAAPLKTGHRYTLVMDAQTGELIQDAHGRGHPEQRLELRVAGEKEKPAPPPAKKKRRRR